MDVVAVDWSGSAQGAAAHIWLAHERDGELVELRNGRTRAQVVDDLIALRDDCPGGLTVGLDFAFSFPQWFVRQEGCTTILDVWALAEVEGERWLSECQPPFWGRPGHRRPELPEHLRRAERDATVGGIGAKSVFQIGGAGAVGTGSVRGMPHLARLHRAGFSIWPFHPPSAWTVVEIYPRLLTGAVHKRNQEHRARYVGGAPWQITPSMAERMVASEDAFDAGISALVMGRHATELSRLVPATDPITLLEGDVWRPSVMEPANDEPAMKLADVIIDCVDPEQVATFWAGPLGRPIEGRKGPYVWLRREDAIGLGFQKVEGAKAGKNRVHVDVSTRDVRAGIQPIEALGGRRAEGYDRGGFLVMTDPEGNEFCLIPEAPFGFDDDGHADYLDPPDPPDPPDRPGGA